MNLLPHISHALRIRQAQPQKSRIVKAFFVGLIAFLGVAGMSPAYCVTADAISVSLSAPADQTQVSTSATFSGTVQGNTGTNISFSLQFGTTTISSAWTSMAQDCVNSYCTSSFIVRFQWAAGLVPVGNQVATLVTTDSTGRTVSVNRMLNVIQPVTTTTSTTTTATTSTTTTTLSTLNLTTGWNLVGNGSDAPIDVATTFSDANRFLTVWKWIAAQSAWGFHAPSLAAQGGTVLADYVVSKGYQLLVTVAGGEGFWVNAKQAGSVNLPNGNAISITTLGPTLIKGWNLVSVGETATPKQFCDAQSSGVTTLWAWDATNSAWYFYAPSLDASGGLVSYITSKGYLDFTTNNKPLGPGMGFWVNKP